MEGGELGRVAYSDELLSVYTCVCSSLFMELLVLLWSFPPYMHVP